MTIDGIRQNLAETTQRIQQDIAFDKSWAEIVGQTLLTDYVNAIGAIRMRAWVNLYAISGVSMALKEDAFYNKLSNFSTQTYGISSMALGAATGAFLVEGAKGLNQNKNWKAITNLTAAAACGIATLLATNDNDTLRATAAFGLSICASVIVSKFVQQPKLKMN